MNEASNVFQAYPAVWAAVAAGVMSLILWLIQRYATTKDRDRDYAANYRQELRAENHDFREENRQLREELDEIRQKNFELTEKLLEVRALLARLEEGA
jgi:uncharacterized membrane protein